MSCDLVLILCFVGCVIAGCATGFFVGRGYERLERRRSEYAKEKREFDEEWKRVAERIGKGRRMEL